jgi:uncharacterized protein YkwD
MVHSSSVAGRKQSTHRRPRPLPWAAALAIMVAALTVAALVSAVPAQASSGAARLVSLTNGDRTAHGAKKLASRSDLTSVALHQAQRMAKSGVLAHNPRLTSEVQHWQKIGENVGYGPDVKTVQQAFMTSSGHRANILDRQFTEVGVGVVVKSGLVWVAAVFRQRDGSKAPVSQPKKHVAKPAAHHAKTYPAKPKATAVVEVDRATPERSKATTSSKPAAPHPSTSPTPVRTSSPSPSPSRPRALTPSAQPSPPSSPPTPPSAQPSQTPGALFGAVAGGPAGPGILAPTQPDSPGGGSTLPAIGALAMLALLGIAISLRVRPTS